MWESLPLSPLPLAAHQALPPHPEPHQLDLELFWLQPDPHFFRLCPHALVPLLVLIRGPNRLRHLPNDRFWVLHSRRLLAS